MLLLSLYRIVTIFWFLELANHLTYLVVAYFADFHRQISTFLLSPNYICSNLLRWKSVNYPYDHCGCGLICWLSSLNITTLHQVCNHRFLLWESGNCPVNQRDYILFCWLSLSHPKVPVVFITFRHHHFLCWESVNHPYIHLQPAALYSHSLLQHALSLLILWAWASLITWYISANHTPPIFSQSDHPCVFKSVSFTWLFLFATSSYCVNTRFYKHHFIDLFAFYLHCSCSQHVSTLPR